MVQWWGEEVSFSYTDKQTKQLGMGVHMAA